jgi:hypothetical protein
MIRTNAPLLKCLCITCGYALLFKQYMQRGTLRLILNTPASWQQYTPIMRHQILCDVTEAMTYLHIKMCFTEISKGMHRRILSLQYL